MNKIKDLAERYPALIFLFFFAVTLVLYAQILSAPPIWDDNYFIFDFQPFQDGLSYTKIWTDFAWPMTASLYKFFLSLFERNYTLYHLMNLLVHSLNAYLIFRIIQKLKLPFAFITSFLFLIHPANLMSVAWMIQLKTLVAFLFFAGSTYFYLDFIQTKKKWKLALFVFFFVLSLLTKSTALFFPVVLIFIHLCYGQVNRKMLIGLVIFLMIALWGGMKLMKSPIVASLNPATDVLIGETLVAKLDFTVQTIWYYLEQAFLPSSFVPVKGILTEIAPLALASLTCFLLVLIILLFLLELNLGLAFLSSIIMMTPFLGIVKAPFMKVTSVSDQHLYLILPALIWVFTSVVSFLMLMLLKNNEHRFRFVAIMLVSFFISYFASSTLIHTKIFENEETFYSKSLDYNPKILSFYINLAAYYQEQNNLDAAVSTINTALEVCQEYPELKKSEMYGLVGAKWFEIEQIVRRRQALEKN